MLPGRLLRYKTGLHWGLGDAPQLSSIPSFAASSKVPPMGMLSVAALTMATWHLAISQSHCSPVLA